MAFGNGSKLSPGLAAKMTRLHAAQSMKSSAPMSVDNTAQKEDPQPYFGSTGKLHTGMGMGGPLQALVAALRAKSRGMTDTIGAKAKAMGKGDNLNRKQMLSTGRDPETGGGSDERESF